MGGHAGDAGHPQRRRADLPDQRVGAGDCHQPPVKADAVIAAHQLLGGPVQLRQPPFEVVRVVSLAEHVVDEVDRFLEVIQRQLLYVVVHGGLLARQINPGLDRGQSWTRVEYAALTPPP